MLRARNGDRRGDVRVVSPAVAHERNGLEFVLDAPPDYLAECQLLLDWRGRPPLVVLLGVCAPLEDNDAVIKVRGERGPGELGQGNAPRVWSAFSSSIRPLQSSMNVALPTCKLAR
jgi:hypothetical protein